MSFLRRKPTQQSSRRRTAKSGPQLSRRARRAQEKLALRKQRELDKIELAGKQLNLDKRFEAHADERVEKKTSRRREIARESRDRLAAKLRAFRTRVANDRPLLMALYVGAFSLAVAIAGQFMFYSSLDWHGWTWIAYLLPFLVEGATWTFATYAQWLATRPVPLPYGTYTRMMWFFAGGASVTNAYHVWITLGDPTTGIVLGAASIIGPIAWHRYITLTKLVRKGMSAAQIRAALFRRIFHPIYSLRAASLWSAAGGAMTPEAAWKITWMNAKGAAPGMAPTLLLVTFRNQWLFKILFGRVINPAIVVTTATAVRGATATRVAQPQPDPEVAQPQPEVVDEVAQPPAIASVEDDASISDDLIKRYLEEWSNLGDNDASATSEAGATATLERPDQPSSEPVAPLQPQPQPDMVDEVAQLDVQPKAQPEPEVVQPEVAQPSASTLITRFYNQERAKGVAPEDVGPSLAHRFVEREGGRCSRQFVSRKLGELRDAERNREGASATGSDDKPRK